MARIAKLAFLRTGKLLGLFKLAGFLTRRDLRILCYHGVALADESAFRPKQFITPATFRKRLHYLSQSGFPVLPLEEALDRMARCDLPSRATVITIDDGFCAVRKLGLPTLQEFSFPATVYVSTYYALKGNPVFRLIVQYLFWKTPEKQLDVTGLGLPLAGRLSLQNPKVRHNAMWEIIHHAETQWDEAQRGALAQALAERLKVDYLAIIRGRLFHILSPAEIRELVAAGMDIQLHTHRHRLPLEETGARREILDNRAALEPLVGKPLEHFCYPNGIWSEAHWPWLTALGIKSAAACELGLNDSGSPRLALKRILDGENLSPIEFEAEMCGFSSLLRSLVARRQRTG